jgi:hypothetical protein
MEYFGGFMKQIFSLFTLFLIFSTSNSFAMQRELKEPSSRIRTAVERALKAFGVPVDSIKIYEEKNGQATGWANSDKKEIGIDSEIKSNDLLNYASFHEAAHIKDDASNKILSQARQFIAAITTGSFLFQSFLIPKTFNKIAQFKKKTPWDFFGATIATSIAAGYFMQNAALQWAMEQAEYRADRMAFEKLIEHNDFEPICIALATKKAEQKVKGNTRSGGHGPASQEFNSMKNTLQNHGFTVQTSKNATNLEIAITKNENVYASGILKNYFSKF